MLGFIVKRLLAATGMIFFVVSFVFLALYLVPGDPAEVLLSSQGGAPSPEVVAATRAKLGLDRSVLEQYVSYLGRIAKADFGTSFVHDEPVLDDIKQRLPRTLELIGAAAALAILIGLPLGTFSALRRGSLLDRALGLWSSVAISVPVFVLGTMLVLVFALTLQIVPAGGFTPFSISPARHMLQLLMPAITIAVGFSATILRMSRATVLEVLEQDWVRTARSKGLAVRHVVFRHVVRNALGPVLTLTGLQMGSLLGGTVLVEYVFNWPGLSGLLVQAVERRDYPVVQGIVLVIAALFIVLNLVVDVLYSALDPRVQIQ
ncbi:peptide/nickel transport system permease protein [Bradyrhizobium diazoefficiens]|uniref:ABC transporter permease n=1 Tax=Bradyrhizobium diazoefficiens TaxID=1355477 RepID=UPI003518FEEF